MRHKLLPVSAGHVTICTRSLVGEGDLVHHCDSGVPEASMLVRSVELYHMFSPHSSRRHSWLAG